MIEFQNLVINESDGERSNIAKHSITYRMFSNVRSLTMEENSQAAVNAFYSREPPVLYSKFEHTTPNPPPPLLIRSPLKLNMEEYSASTKLRHLPKVGLRGNSQTPEVTKENLGLTYLLHSHDQYQNCKDCIMKCSRSGILAEAINNLNFSWP